MKLARLLGIATCLTVIGCPAQDGAKAPDSKDPTKEAAAPAAADPRFAVPAGVSHVQNPAHKKMPTPTDMPDFDPKTTAEAAKKLGVAMQGERSKACKENPDTFVRLIREGTRMGYVSYKNENLPVAGFFEEAMGWAVLGDKPTANLWINPLSLNSGDPVRDRKLLKLFFQLEDDKNHAFVFTSKKIDGKLPAGDGTSKITMTGTLTLHNKSVEMTLPFDVTRKGGALSAKGTAEIPLLKLAGFDLIEPLKALLTSCNHKAMGDAVALQLELGLSEGCKK